MAQDAKSHCEFRLRSIACVLVLVGVLMAPTAGGAAQVREYQVKAAYLFQFLNFVTWPERAFLAADAPYEICILGIDPFASDLDHTVRGKQVRGRSVHVQRLANPRSARGCHILFIGSSERTRLALILEAVAGLPLLTVGEFREFEQQGGMIRFVMERNNVRLRINSDSSASAGVEISSKLLAVATVVRGGRGD